MDKVKIGVLGTGAISGIYFKNLTKVFSEVEVVAVCDLFVEKAKEAAEEYQIPKVYETMEEMLADGEIEIILNLTRPNEHYKTTRAALLAGKHVYSEKPLAAVYEEGNAVSIQVYEENTSLVGNIYVGKVRNILRSINAVFVELSGGQICYYEPKHKKVLYTLDTCKL